MRPKSIPLILVLISITALLILASCIPTEEQTDTLSPVATNRAQSESLNTEDSSTPSGTVSSVPDVDTSEPVSVTTDSNNLYIANNSSNAVYFEAFPQEMLAVIEWGPCDNPEECQDKLVKPNSESSIPLRKVASRETTTITVFWWNLEKITNEERYEVINLNFIDLSIDR